MTARGRFAAALGAATYLAAWAFGSRALYPVAVGLLLVVALAWAWVRLANRPMRLARPADRIDRFEGEDVPVELELRVDGRVSPAAVTVVERYARLGERRTELRRRHGLLAGSYVLPHAARGRYALEDARAEIEDPFGLARVEVPLESRGALIVYPRLVDLERIFSESGAHAQEGRRLLLRRPTGFDLHSVREHAEGESLRMVHWRSTARRGQLMVKELEDAPRDEVAILLDGDASAVVGESFEVQVRAAGSLLLAHARRGRRAVIVVNSQQRETQRVLSYEGDWRRALELLAAVEPTGRTPVAALLAEEASAAARALELAVVTAALPPRLADRLVQRALARRPTSLVWVDSASFNGVAPRPEPTLLRLQAAGVPVAVLRRGDDLAAQLSAARMPRAAHG